MQQAARSLLRFARKTPEKSPARRFFTLQTPKAAPIIGIFALLMAQKSTNATGCW
jgi:hypothetical protein